MNSRSIPQILQDESRFEACAYAAARHVANQPEHVRAPIARYGRLLYTQQPADSGVLYGFYRAVAQAQLDRWTAQLADYPEDHARLEEAIATNVYLAQSALALNVIDESQQS